MKPFILSMAAALLMTTPSIAPAADWVPAWTASPQPLWSADFIFPTDIPGDLANSTVRQIVHLGIGGDRVRVRLSNTYGEKAVLVSQTTVGRSTGASAIQPGSSRALTFGGQREVTLPPGASLVSDPIELPVQSGENLAVSLYFAKAPPVGSFHWDGRKTGFIGRGNLAAAPAISPNRTTTRRLFLTDILVDEPDARGTVVVLGDSIADGAGATLDADTRWPDYLAARAAPRGIAVVNAGISGARLLGDRMGTNAFARFDQDVLAQPKVKTVILALGINDIAWPGSPFAPKEKAMTFERLTTGYRQLAEQARGNGIRVIGTTLAPFDGALPNTPLSATFYSAEKDKLRRQVNAWIRTSGTFDEVIDFDALLRDGTRPARISEAFDSGDRLHPGDAGNKAMADAVNLDTILGDAK